MRHIIACRSGIFGDPETAYAVLARNGVRNAETNFTGVTDFARLKAIATAAGVTITTLSGGCDVDNAESRQALRLAMAGASQIGTAKLFVSFKSEKPLEGTTIEALRDLAREAGDLGVTLCMETHPPFGTNAGTALRTFEAVGLPGLRYNFDTANLYYYNHGINAVDQLRYCRELVGSVHLKDTPGGHHDANFPILGQGVVEFPAIFALLDGVGFEGPYTMELEGHCLDQHAAGREDFLKRCVVYLKAIGAMA